MLQSLQEYHEYWQNDITWWENADVTRESCIFFETGDTPMAEGLYALPDFGHAICFYRYFRAPTEPEPPQERSTDISALLPGLAFVERIWGQHQPKMTDHEFRANWAATERTLDALLGEFAAQGYRTGMKERLREIVNDSLIGFDLHEIFLLPGDLDAVLSFAGNPLIDEDAYESYEQAKANAPAFDLNNPEHCKALKERIMEFGL
jgi:hypothetical protein